MKVHSSAQRKEAFQAIQHCCNMPVLQLLVDMKVRWSSTFIMLTCAKSRQEAIDEFVLWFGLKETSTEK